MTYKEFVDYVEQLIKITKGWPRKNKEFAAAAYADLLVSFAASGHQEWPFEVLQEYGQMLYKFLTKKEILTMMYEEEDNQSYLVKFDSLKIYYDVLTKGWQGVRENNVEEE